MGMEFGIVFWALAALGAAAAIAYGASYLNRPHGWLRAGVKTAFMAAFAGALISAGAPTPLILAVIASAFGDFFLAFDKKWLLPFGILSFLIAQLLYVLIFGAVWFFSGDNSPLLPRYVAMALVIATACGFLIWMAPKLGWMALGVVPYALAITLMGVTAMWLPWPAWPAMIGALSFLVSDFVLAAELFRLPPDSPARRVTAPVVWWTYAAAQVLIIWGVLVLARQM
ncbi:MAG: lysoplasmalogenase [Hyphomonadaceae bacterium JAD_PAG50586_4]|nr:MAG: lysoplasmalogenase [Hyphomonadaceae bacterium JAD_PAG50586_4]